MFDFEKLDVYQHVKLLNSKTLRLFEERDDFDTYVVEKWKKASLDIILNLSESTGRISNESKIRYLAKSRGSVFKCVSILEIIYSHNLHFPKLPIVG